MIPLATIAMGAFTLVKSLIAGGSIMSTVSDVLDAVARGDMNASEAKARIAEAEAAAWAEAEKAYMQASADIFAEAQQTIRASFTAKSWAARNAWAFVVLSQTLVLLWYQIGIPVYVWAFSAPFPRTGDDLLQWAYALVAGALGIGVAQSRWGK